MKVRFTPRALAAAKRMKTWWLENRPASPDLFDEEVAEALKQIAAAPSSGVVYPTKLGVVVRRILLEETQNHVYYAVRGDEVVILTVWGAPRGRGPKL